VPAPRHFSCAPAARCVRCGHRCPLTSQPSTTPWHCCSARHWRPPIHSGSHLLPDGSPVCVQNDDSHPLLTAAQHGDLHATEQQLEAMGAAPGVEADKVRPGAQSVCVSHLAAHTARWYSNCLTLLLAWWLFCSQPSMHVYRCSTSRRQLLPLLLFPRSVLLLPPPHHMPPASKPPPGPAVQISFDSLAGSGIGPLTTLCPAPPAAGRQHSTAPGSQRGPRRRGAAAAAIRGGPLCPQPCAPSRPLLS
jgi:hypothetical protein